MLSLDVKARRATRLIILAIGNHKYNNVRAIGDKFKNYVDIPEAITDVECFIIGARTLKGFHNDDVIKLIDTTKNSLDQALKDLRSKIDQINADAKAKGIQETIVVAAYYAGHGTQDGFNYALMNEANQGDGMLCVFELE